MYTPEAGRHCIALCITFRAEAGTFKIKKKIKNIAAAIATVRDNHFELFSNGGEAFQMGLSVYQSHFFTNF